MNHNRKFSFIIMLVLITIVCSCSNPNKSPADLTDETIVDNSAVGEVANEPEYKYFKVCDGDFSETEHYAGKMVPEEERAYGEMIEYRYIYYCLETSEESTIETIQKIMAEIYEIEKKNLNDAENPGLYLWDNEENALNNIPDAFAKDDRFDTLVFAKFENLPGVLENHPRYSKEPDVFRFYYYGNQLDGFYAFSSYWIEFHDGEFTKIESKN